MTPSPPSGSATAVPSGRCAALVFLLALLTGLSPALAQEQQPRNEAKKSPHGKVTFFNEGKQFVLGVDLRPAVVGKPEEFLPLNLVLVNLRGGPGLAFSREGLTLELADGRRLPLASVEEVHNQYHQMKLDLRLSEEFVAQMRGLYHVPPFQELLLDFYPLRETGIVPRKTIDFREATRLFGIVYFRVPKDALSRPMKLLVHFSGDKETYVVPFRLP